MSCRSRAHLSCTPTWISGAIRAAFHHPGVCFPHSAALCLPCTLKGASVGGALHRRRVSAAYSSGRRKTPSSTGASAHVQSMPTTCKHVFSLLLDPFPLHLVSTEPRSTIGNSVLPGIHCIADVYVSLEWGPFPGNLTNKNESNIRNQVHLCHIQHTGHRSQARRSTFIYKDLQT